jgi:hypothetical protein
VAEIAGWRNQIIDINDGATKYLSQHETDQKCHPKYFISSKIQTKLEKEI